MQINRELISMAIFFIKNPKTGAKRKNKIALLLAEYENSYSFFLDFPNKENEKLLIKKEKQLKSSFPKNKN